MAVEAEIRDELKMILDSFKARIMWSKENGQPIPFATREVKKQVCASSVQLVDNTVHTGDIVGQVMGLTEVREELGDCRRCSLAALRKNLVFGEGNSQADLVFVGEAPGADEDREGQPFVGRAGQLLTKIIDAMGLARKDVYICNILKCRPPGNRNPETAEIAACEPFLIKQLQAISPRVICALGTFAAQTLLKKTVPITALRGRFHTYEGIKLMPTFHPAYLLRNPSAKKQVWEDVQTIMKELSIGRG